MVNVLRGCLITVLQIENMGRDTLNRVLIRFPSGIIVPGLIRGKKSLLIGFIPKFCFNSVRVCIIKKERTNPYNMYRDMMLGKKVNNITVSKRYDTFIFNNDDTSGLFEVYKVVG